MDTFSRRLIQKAPHHIFPPPLTWKSNLEDDEQHFLHLFESILFRLWALSWFVVLTHSPFFFLNEIIQVISTSQPIVRIQLDSRCESILESSKCYGNVKSFDMLLDHNNLNILISIAFSLPRQIRRIEITLGQLSTLLLQFQPRHCLMAVTLANPSPFLTWGSH